jgi:hypothetical protein
LETPPPSPRTLARQLLALEAHGTVDVDGRGQAAVRVCDKLGHSLTRFAGPAGFASLLRRALALASADIESLKSIKVDDGGCLTGFAAVALDPAGGGPEAAVAVIARLLELLVNFIGEPLTLQLVRESWPSATSHGLSEESRPSS